MAAERLAMRSVKKLFELRYQVGLSQLQTAKALGVGRATVQRYEKLVREKGLQGPDLCTLSESELS